MKIISHRGYWINANEKNKTTAFERSFRKEFGTETDLRDCCGDIVISHDMPSGGEIKFEDLLSCYLKNNVEKNLPLALNIKSDGLADRIAQILSKEKFNGINLFMFDMAIPDMLQYIKKALPVYMRMSEVERDTSLLERCDGIWLDSFDNEWYTDEDLQQILKNHNVCIVSSELHGREKNELWSRLRKFRSQNNLTLCTDYPEDFKKFIEI